MYFNSLNYLLFLPVVFIAHYFTPARFRWVVLLLASFIFYAALDAPQLILILLLVTSIAYFTGLWIQKSPLESTKLKIMWVGICSNVLLLGILKYPSTSKTFIAIGTSYYIFQAIAYMVDVYLEKIAPEKHYGYFALYMSFFPKLLQGPIERGENLLPQLRQPYTFNYENVRTGMVMFAWGLFKKIVVADRLTAYTNNVFGDVELYGGISLLLALYFYAIQIYCDFSGYTDMARGTARMLNIRLAPNFKNPYGAESIREFWKRWHISLSSWLQDYIFIPLQLQLRFYGKSGTVVALITTFLICGAWHGFTECFLVWGMLHGIYLSVYFLLSPFISAVYKRLPSSYRPFCKLANIFVTFHLVCISWVFFRADSMHDALYFLTHITSTAFDQLASFAEHGIFNRNLKIGGQFQWNLAANFVAILVWVCGTIMYKIYRKRHSTLPMSLRWSFYTFLVISLMFLGTSGTNNFMYVNY